MTTYVTTQSEAHFTR